MLKGKDYAEYSDYPELQLPDIEMQIPEELLQNLDPTTKYLYIEQNRQTQYITWMAKTLVDINRQVRITNGRVKKVENWKTMLTNSWSLTVFGLVLFSTLVTLFSKIFSFVI